VLPPEQTPQSSTKALPPHSALQSVPLLSTPVPTKPNTLGNPSAASVAEDKVPDIPVSP